ncbi:MAG: hypothetical protein J6A01_02840 [Proteobacteria bacterium]|nr:hypothetical protein [Pseudomonadota bacterium]
MKKIPAFLLLLAFIGNACSDEETSISMCDCEPDEYCVDDECVKTNSEVAPAPLEDSQH